MEIGPFPASDFDEWANTYDQSVLDENHFPFTGYQQALETIVRLAAAQPGMRVLDVGTATANLAARFVALGCRLWATDFSPAMLAEARRKLPQAKYLLADLRQGWPAGLPPTFERIVSAYVFHHFELTEKVRLLLAGRAPGAQGKLVMADIAFPDQAGLEKVRRMVGDEWEDEYYWLADETVAASRQAGLNAAFTPVSACAGVFVVEKR
jgi:putative AdoMet-dependent methyltransferase